MSERLSAAFIDAAKSAFLRNGYSDTSMTSIAATVGSSKTTLWSRFRSKEALFAAVINELTARFDELLRHQLVHEGAPDTLRDLGRSLSDLARCELATSLHELLGEAKRNPELAYLARDARLADAGALISASLSSMMRVGALRQGDADMAGRQFVALLQASNCAGTCFCYATWCYVDPREAETDLAVHAFLKIWGL